MCQEVRFGVYSMPLVECANNILALLLSEDRLNYKQQLPSLDDTTGRAKGTIAR
jgi:hypothetical protein